MANKINTDIGIEVIPVADIEGFRAAISDLLKERAPLEVGFRGQEQASWELKPSLFRYLENISYDKSRVSFKTAVSVLEDKYREALIGNSDISQDIIREMDIWHLGQHYGLATPQLDWSYSPWVALYFSMERPTKEDQDLSAVWVLDIGVLNILNASIRSEVWPEHGGMVIGGDFVENFPTMDIQIVNDENNRRLLSQQGFFTKHYHFHTFEVWLYKAIENLGWDMNKTVGPLKKITIPRSAINRKKILRELQLMNIAPRTLFPDIWGSSKEAMYQMEQHITASHGRVFSIARKQNK